MNIIIFEDDIDFTNRLKALVKNIPHSNLTVNFTTSNYTTLSRHLELLETPTIFLLDIMLNNSPQGLQMADIITRRHQAAIIIFITDYPDKILTNTPYKIKAFNIILKSSRQLEHELTLTLLEALKFTEANNILIHSDKFTTIQIQIEEIFYIETVINRNKICIYAKSGSYELRTSLKNLIERLPDYFLRCHNSYIVNTRKITSISYSTHSLKMANGGICYYSSKNRKRLDERIKSVGGNK
ncbi:MAG: response regulator transcription factor [Defluviitaleaceae bacterium]|nr:response regulator transcription factor [Defluviitaleaceae bacterium]